MYNQKYLYTSLFDGGRGKLSIFMRTCFCAHGTSWIFNSLRYDAWISVNISGKTVETQILWNTSRYVPWETLALNIRTYKLTCWPCLRVFFCVKRYRRKNKTFVQSHASDVWGGTFIQWQRTCRIRRLCLQTTKKQLCIYVFMSVLWQQINPLISGKSQILRKDSNKSTTNINTLKSEVRLHSI